MRKFEFTKFEFPKKAVPESVCSDMNAPEAPARGQQVEKIKTRVGDVL